MKQALRLILDDPGPGSWNMAVDETIATAPAPRPLTLRFYDWRVPTVSLGRHQPVSAIDLMALRREGMELVRRPTGGMAVLHFRELTLSLAGPAGAWGDLGLGDVVSLLARGISRALRAWDVKADSHPGPAPGEHPPGTIDAACFSGGGRHEVWVGERKIAGLAGRRWGRAFLVHGSLLMNRDHIRITELLSGSAAEREAARRYLEERTVVLEDLGLGSVPTWVRLAEGIAGAVGDLLGEKPELGTLSPAEEVFARNLDRRRHATEEWVLGGVEMAQSFDVTGVDSPGGLGYSADER